VEELIACASAARVAEAFHKLDRDKPRSNVPTQQFTLCATPLGKHMPASASHPSTLATVCFLRVAHVRHLQSTHFFRSSWRMQAKFAGSLCNVKSNQTRQYQMKIRANQGMLPGPRHFHSYAPGSKNGKRRYIATNAKCMCCVMMYMRHANAAQVASRLSFR
jgi:hypothetical protein